MELFRRIPRYFSKFGNLIDLMHLRTPETLAGKPEFATEDGSVDRRYPPRCGNRNLVLGPQP